MVVAGLSAAVLSVVVGGSAPAANLLNIDVVALDSRGQPVIDLKPSEFELWINGFQIPIETVTFVSPTNSEVPRTIVLLLDDMAISQSVLPRVREAARRFVNQMLPSDSMAIVSLNGDVMESTRDRARLLKAIDAYHLRGFPIRIDDAASHVLTTITALSRQLSEAPGGRKAIVALGTGWLFDTPIPPPTVGRDLRAEWVAAMRATASAHVSLYVIDPIGVGMRPVDSGTSGFARETGGHAFVSTNDINGAVDRILRETATYYVLSAQDPPIGRKSDLREVQVKVLRRGISARARKAIPPGV